MNPVYQEIGEENEDGKLQVIVTGEWLLVESIVELGVAFDLKYEEASCKDSHAWHGRLCLLDFHPHLVLEVFRVIEGRFVEDEYVGESGANEVEDDTEEPDAISKVGIDSLTYLPCNEEQLEELSFQLVSWPSTLPSILRRREGDIRCRRLP